MRSLSQIVLDVQQNWALYASLPLVAAAIGYVTKLVAIRMMFEPVEFVGLRPPYLGWQGIVPRRAEAMARIACDTMTAHLIRPDDIMGRLDPERVARELDAPLRRLVEDVTREVAMQYAPGLWEAAPSAVKQTIIRRAQAEAPGIVRQVMEEIRSSVDTVFDLRHMVVTTLTRDKRLLNRIFQEAGAEEFRFIARSGIYFGLAIGCVQSVAWALTHNVWVMPIFGGLTGWLSDWLALRMVFSPKEPTRYLGVFEWQGLFLKRRREVAAAYGAFIATEIVTPKNILESVLRGPLSDRMLAVIQKQVQAAVDEQAGLAKPLIVLAVGSAQYQAMKRRIAEKILARLPAALKHVEKYAGEAMDLRNTLVLKMQQLSPEEFERLLRPAFQQDEWILIAVGAVLGFLVGELQVFLMVH